MSVNGVTKYAPSYMTQNYGNTKKAKEEAEKAKNEEETTEVPAAVYEPSENVSSKTYTPNSEKVNQMKLELNSKSEQMQNLVNALFSKQGKKGNSVIDLIKGIKNGTISVDAATSAKAQEEIGEDGYWGVNKTSDRLVEMAQALSGGDPAKADMMIEAMKKGFKDAGKAIGGKLPDICSQTIDAAVKKMNDWKVSFTS